MSKNYRLRIKDNLSIYKEKILKLNNKKYNYWKENVNLPLKYLTKNNTQMRSNPKFKIYKVKIN